MAYVVNLATHLEIDGIPLSTPAWEQTNLYTMLGVGSARGDNVVMPGAVGRRAVRRRTDELTVTIDLAIRGGIDPRGVVHADPIAGLIANIDELRDNLVDPPAAYLNSVRPAIIHLPTGTLTAGVQVLGFEIVEAYNPTEISASMDICVVEGRFR